MTSEEKGIAEITVTINLGDLHADITQMVSSTSALRWCSGTSSQGQGDAKKMQ